MTDRERDLLRAIKGTLDAKDQVMLRAKGALELAKRHLNDETAASVTNIIDEAIAAINTL